MATCGPRAADLLSRTGTAQVTAVFARSLYVERNGRLACIGSPAIGNGPLNAVLSISPPDRWLDGISPGTSVVVDKNAIVIGKLTFDTTHAHLWQPLDWPTPNRPTLLAADLSRLIDSTRQKAPEDGLFRCALLPETTSPTTPVARIAAPRIACLIAWLEETLAATPECPSPPPPTDLLGLGPGLTPSGDDLLAGVVVALRSVREADTADRLAQALLTTAPAATTSLSAQLLAAAAEGFAHEALHDLLIALLTADLPAANSALARLDRIGHTSGWDAAAGAILALRAWAAARRAPRSP